MAELNQESGNDRRAVGVPRSKKRSTKIDLTPMVDLGFLLVTFFMLCATWSKPSEMSMLLPAGKARDTKVGDNVALTIIPLNDNTIFYYHGEFEKAIKEKKYGSENYNSRTGIGRLIREKKLSLRNGKKFKAEDLMLIIKPVMESKYRNIVDALDEILIHELKHYAFDDISEAELSFLKENGILK